MAYREKTPAGYNLFDESAGEILDGLAEDARRKG
jgi:hypothetical protein